MNDIDDDDAEIPPQEDRKVSKFLYISYILTILWGLWAFFAYWNGAQGWPKRAQWRKLQEAAKTTFPFEKKKLFTERKDR